MRKIRIQCVKKPTNRDDDSLLLEENDRLDTLEVKYEHVKTHRRNPSQFLAQKYSEFLPLNQKENIPPTSRRKSSCSGFNIESVIEGEITMTQKNPSSYPIKLSEINSNIRTLDLCESKLNEFPKEVFKLNQLITLRLNGNNIKEIPSDITKLSKLEVLIVSVNCIRELNSSLSSLKQLTHLAANNNKLEEWPNWLCCLNSLSHLYIQDNNLISGIPANLGKVCLLEELGFDWLAYITENNSKTIKTKNSLFTQLKELCKETKDSQITFKQFINYFKPQFKDKRCLFHMTAILNQVNFVELNEDINIKDKDSLTPLALAIKHNNTDAIEVLLKSPHIKVSEQIGKHGSALHLAIYKNKWNVSMQLIKHNTFIPNIQDVLGNTALHLLFSIFDKDPIAITEVCLCLLKHEELNPNMINNNDFSALHNAAKENQIQAILFAIKINKNKEYFDFSLAGGAQRFTVLHYMAVYEHTELVNKLLQAGADPLAADSEGRIARCMTKSRRMKKLLLRAEKNCRVNIKKKLVTYEETSMIVNRATLIKEGFSIPIEAIEDKIRLSDKVKSNSLVHRVIAYTTKKNLMFGRLHKMNEQLNYSQASIQNSMILDSILDNQHLNFSNGGCTTTRTNNMLRPPSNRLKTQADIRTNAYNHFMDSKSLAEKYRVLYNVIKEDKGSLGFIYNKLNNNKLKGDMVYAAKEHIKELVGESLSVEYELLNKKVNLAVGYKQKGLPKYSLFDTKRKVFHTRCLSGSSS